MYPHAPDKYMCPFCRFEEGDNAIRPSEIVYQDAQIIAFISRDWWPNNPGHVLITPREHFENIYVLPDDLSDRIHRLEKCVAIAFKKVYLCDGVSSRQHNEPSGSQL
ncbi:MAG: histidine triad (HIT) family protein [Candidatus Latescibacterota bacterium]|jgi:histidine triad (HIT) family protein